MNTNPKDKSSENMNKKPIEGKKCTANLVLSEVLFEESTKNTDNQGFSQSKTVPTTNIIKQKNISTQGEENIVMKKCEICHYKDKINKSNNEEIDKIKSKKYLAVKCPTRATPVDTQTPKLSQKTQIIKCRAEASGTKNLSEQRGCSVPNTHSKSSNKNSLKQEWNSAEMNPPSNPKLKTTEKIEVEQEKNRRSSSRICSARAMTPQASKAKVSSKMQKNSHAKQTKTKKYEVAKLSDECVCPESHPKGLKKCSANKHYAQQKYSLRKSFLKSLSSLLTEIQKINIIPAFQKLSDDEIEEQAISINNSVCPYKCSSPVKVVVVESEITKNIPSSSTPTEKEFILRQKVSPCKSVCNRQTDEDKESDHIVNKESESNSHEVKQLDTSLRSTLPPITKPSLNFILPPPTSLRNIESYLCPTVCPSRQLSATKTEIGDIKEPCKSIICTKPKVIECKSVVCNPKPKIICQSKVCGVKSEPGYVKRIVTEGKPITELDAEVVWKSEKVAGVEIKPKEALEIKQITKLGEGIKEEIVEVISETKSKGEQEVGAVVTPGVRPEVIAVEPGIEPFVKLEFEDGAEVKLDTELAVKPDKKLAEKLGLEPIVELGEKVESKLEPLREAAVKPSIEPAVKPQEVVVKPGAESTVKPIVEPSVEEESVLKSLEEVAVKPSVKPAEEPGELVVKPGVGSTVIPIVEPSVEQESVLKSLKEDAIKPSVKPAEKPGVESTVIPLVEPSVNKFVEPVPTQGLGYVEISEKSAGMPEIQPPDKSKVDTVIKPGEKYAVIPVEGSKARDSAVTPKEVTGFKPGAESKVPAGEEYAKKSGDDSAKLNTGPAEKLREDPAMQLKVDIPVDRAGLIPEVEIKRQEREKVELDKSMPPLDSKIEEPTVGSKTVPELESVKKSGEDSAGLPVTKLDMEHAEKLGKDPAMQLKTDTPKMRDNLKPGTEMKQQDGEVGKLDKSMQPLDSKIEKPTVGSKTVPELESAKKSGEDSTGLPVTKLDMEHAEKLGKEPAMQLKTDTPKVRDKLKPETEMKQQDGEVGKLDKSMQPLDSKIEKPTVGSKTVPELESAKKSGEDSTGLPVTKLDMEHAEKLGKEPAMQLKTDTPKVRDKLKPGTEMKQQDGELGKLDKSMQPLDLKIEKPTVGSKTVPELESAKKSGEDSTGLPVTKLDMEHAEKLGKDPAMQLKTDTPKVRDKLKPGTEMKQQYGEVGKLDKSMQPLDSKQDKSPETKTVTGITTQSKPEVEPPLKTITKQQAKVETDLPEKSKDTKQKLQLEDVESIPVDKVLKKEQAESKLSPLETIISKSELKQTSELKPDYKQKSEVKKVIGKISEPQTGAKIDSSLATDVQVEAAMESGKVVTEPLEKKEKSKATKKLDTGHKQDEKMSDIKAEEKRSEAKADAEKVKVEAYTESKIDNSKIDKEKEKQKGKEKEREKDKERDKDKEKEKGKEGEKGEPQLKLKADFEKPDAQLEKKLKPKLDSKKIDTSHDEEKEKTGQKRKTESEKFGTFDQKEKPEPQPKVDSEKFDAIPQERKEKTDLKSKPKIQKEQKIYEIEDEKSKLTPKPKASVPDIKTKEKLKSAASKKTDIGIKDGSKIPEAQKADEKHTEAEKSTIKVISEKGETVGSKDTHLKQDRGADEKLIPEYQLDGTEKTTEQISELVPETTDQVKVIEKDAQSEVTTHEEVKKSEKKQIGKLGIEDEKGMKSDAEDTEMETVAKSRDEQEDKISRDITSIQKQKLGDKIKGRKPLRSEIFDKESEGKVPIAYSEKQIESKLKIGAEKLDRGQEARPGDTIKSHKDVTADELKIERKDDVLGKEESQPKTLKKASKCACTQLRSRKSKRPTLTKETCFCDKGLVTELTDECTCHKLSKDKQYTCAQTETTTKTFKSASCSTVEQNLRDRNAVPYRSEYLPLNIEKGRPTGAGQLESHSFSGVPIPRFKETKRNYYKRQEDPNFVELLIEMMEGPNKLMDSKRQEITELLHCTCDKNKEELDFAKVLLQLLDEFGFQRKTQQKCSCEKKVHKRKLSKQGRVSCTCPVGGPSRSVAVDTTNEKERVGDIGKVRCVETCSRKKCTCLSALKRQSDSKLIQSKQKTME